YYVDRRDEFAVSDNDRALILEHAQTAGVEIVRVPSRRIRSLPKDVLWLIRDVRRRRIALAVVQAHGDPRYAALSVVLPVALILHDPLTHSGDAVSRLPLPMRVAARVAEVTSACLIIHSTVLAEQIRPLLRRLPRGVVPHGADMAVIPTAVPQERRLLVFGRLFAYKGVDTALDAMRLLPEELRDVKLIVAGRGPLAELARNRSDVELRDEYIVEADVGSLLDEVRLVLLPYKDATQSGVGSLAVARGIPCVVSQVGGLPELVRDASPNLVVPPDDPARLADAIVEYIDHDDALRRAIYDYSAANFAWPAVAMRLRSELYRLGFEVAPDDLSVVADLR
ncbi:MAG TPA: glycosyltransferase family 4 protein, partial [Solirubrobacteraceae bacterium]|nr:glycosyltransferase family 4 protein [Solirubrobacteraceae bacterium]